MKLLDHLYCGYLEFQLGVLRFSSYWFEGSTVTVHPSVKAGNLISTDFCDLIGVFSLIYPSLPSVLSSGFRGS